MLSPIDAAAQRFLNSVNNVQARLDTAQQQISSGLRVSKPSDDPDQVSNILQLRADILRNDDIKSALGRIESEVDTGEEVLSNCVDLIEGASVLASEATSSTQTADTRAQIAESVQGILEKMISNSQTTSQGRYIFSGDLDQQPLYKLDLTQTTGVTRLATASSTRLAQAPGGATFSYGLSANDIFDHSDAVTGEPLPGNVFAALNGLRVALLNNDTGAIASSITALDTCSTYMNRQLALYGQAQNHVSSALTQTDNIDTRLRTELGGKEDADLTEAILELSQGQVQLQATLEARSARSNKSLFDYLNS